MRVRRLAQNLLLMVAVLLAFLLLSELSLRVVIPLMYRPRFTRLDSSVGWYHHPSVATTSVLEGHTYRESYNSHGYRGPEHTLDKPASTLRMVVLGDSFVDGSEVGDEELFTWHLQQGLPNVEVINLGVYGYSTAQELITLERTGLRYRPDLVVLLTMRNDFTGNGVNFSYFGPAPRYLLDGDSLRLEPTTSPAAKAAFRATNLPAPGMTFLHRHSLLYYFLNHFIFQRLNDGQIHDLLEAQKRALTPDQSLELYRRLVGRMKHLCEERGIGFLVVFGYERSELRKGHESPNTQVRQLLARDSVVTVDLYSALSEAELASDSSIYYRGDIHWNARGHQVVANLLRLPLERALSTPQRSGGTSETVR